ncbi:hypothetical protein FRC11_006783, partial [Ceratobasidium sp. 423]
MLIHYDVNVNAETEDQGNLMNQLARYFGTMYVEELQLNAVGVRAQIDSDTLESYGCFCLTGNGDHFCTAGLIMHNQEACNNSFMRYEILPNANASLPDAPNVPIQQVYYGQLLNIYYIEFITDIDR